LRKIVPALSLVVILALTGCTVSTSTAAPTPSPSDERLTPEQCDRYLMAFEDFQKTALTPGQSDEELRAASEGLLTTWRDLATEAAPTAGAIVELVALTFEAGIDAGLDSARYREFLEVHEMMLEECGNAST
jgi:hypothetical protein